MRLIRELVLSVIMAVGMFMLIDTLTVRSHVEGPSMEPTLHRGQMLLISRLGISGLTREAYASAHPGDGIDEQGWVPPRGAIVTFFHPFDPTTMLVKRVVGLPGEEIAIDRGQVYIDGHLLDEPYVIFPDTISVRPERIPQDSIFAMGDNRAESGDSRSFGPVPRSHLLGVVVLRYWPFAQLQWMLPTY